MLADHQARILDWNFSRLTEWLTYEGLRRLLVSWLKYQRWWTRLFRSDLPLQSNDWMRSRELRNCILTEFVLSTWLTSIQGTGGILSIWGMVRRVREYARSWCSKLCEREIEHCSIRRIGWMRILMYEKLMKFCLLLDSDLCSKLYSFC
jgi:hypothetical protein